MACKFGSYCSICGKIGNANREWYNWVVSDSYHNCGSSEPTEMAKLEIDPATRTLPTYYLEDVFTQKYVDR